MHENAAQSLELKESNYNTKSQIPQSERELENRINKVKYENTVGVKSRCKKQREEDI